MLSIPYSSLLASQASALNDMRLPVALFVQVKLRTQSVTFTV
jgi:hypothetical protein